MRFSFLDGVFAGGMIGFTQEYFTPFLLLMSSTARHVALLAALPNIFASLIQLKTADLAEKARSRKKVITTFVFMQAVMLLPMALLALRQKAHPGFFIAMVILFTSFGAISSPAWGSLMSDLVPNRKRGAYFGWRNRIVGFIIVGMAFTAGCILNFMKEINVYFGFALIFFLAFVFRLGSWAYLKKMHEPHLEIKKEHYFSIIQFFVSIRKSNFARFVLFSGVMNFSVHMASPFFSMFMLRDLKFSYLTYTTVTVAATLTIYLMMGRWGLLADRIGNLRVIKFTSSLIGVIPLLWLVSRNPVFLVFAQIFSGLLWSGFTLCSTNFIYDAVTPQKRTRCISYFNLVNGLALGGGALAGGFAARGLPPVLGYKLLTLFLVSALLRFASARYLPAMVKEVRVSEHASNSDIFLSMTGIKALKKV